MLIETKNLISLRCKITMILDDKNVIILGAGGAAKAIAVECALEGAKNITIVNRTLSKAEELSKVIMPNNEVISIYNVVKQKFTPQEKLLYRTSRKFSRFSYILWWKY